MPNVSTEVCLAAFYIYCTNTKRKANGSVVECSSAAGNYRAEILGELVVQLVLRAASQLADLPYAPVQIDCDNVGVVKHGNTPSNRPLKAFSPFIQTIDTQNSIQN